MLCSVVRTMIAKHSLELPRNTIQALHGVSAQEITEHGKQVNKTTNPVVLDALDGRILTLLQLDASVSNQALSAAAHTSPATCLRRVQRMKRAGVITRQVALVDESRLREVLTAIVEVTLDRQGAEHLDEFEARCIRHPAVRQCHRVAPGPDFVLVAQATGMPAWLQVVDALFTQAANVRNVKTYFSIKRAKFETAVVLPGPASRTGKRNRPAAPPRA